MKRHDVTDDSYRPHDANAPQRDSDVSHEMPVQRDIDMATAAAVIRTPDQRVRVFISSTLEELGPERAAARAAITHLHLIPVLFESGARAHPPRDLYRAYLSQSGIFVGIYWQRYGRVAPSMALSGLEDEYLLAHDKPKLIYIKAPTPTREPRLQALLDRIRDDDVACYRRFSTTKELQELLEDDLALVLTEHFEQTRLGLGTGVGMSGANVPELPKGTVTFLVTDIAGSTRLLQQLGAEHHAAMHAVHDRLVRAAFAAHDGREVEAAGDRFFVAFASAPDAVAAAAEAQQLLACHPWREEEAPHVRMGLHTGAAHVVGGRYVGLDVHRAGRIAAAGYGGQVLLSDITRALVEQELPAGASLRDLGLYQLKDLQQPERIFQLVLSSPPGLPQVASDFPSLNTLDHHAHNLPTRTSPLLGREQEVAAIGRLVRQDDIRLVTLTGPGGVGKTWLASQVATELASEFADGVWFVGLAHVTNSALVLSTIARTLGLQETGGMSIGDALRQHLASRRLLLLLDNCEHVAAAALDVADLLVRCPRLSILATSRTTLCIQGEHEVLVAPLALPPTGLASGRQVLVDQLLKAPAVALFVARAQAHRPDFCLTESNAPAVVEICIRLDGLPLAIDLAAARVKLLSPQQLLARLERRLPLLTDRRRDIEARQQTMRNTLAWSENLLSSEERRLFRRLAVFVGGVTLEAAEAVCVQPADAEPLGIDILEGLGALVDHSLLQAWTLDRDGETGTETRFRWLYIIREYAQERLEASDEVAAIHAAHATYYLALAEHAGLELRSAGQRAEEWLRRMRREYDNVRAALRWLCDSGQVMLGLRLAVGIGDFWIAHARFSEGRSWLEELLAQMPQSETSGKEADIPAVMQAKARALLGTLAFLLGDDITAAAQLEAALTLGRVLADRQTVIYALGSLGDLARMRGEAERAAARYEEMATAAREAGGPAAAAQALAGEGLAAYERGEWERAAVLLEEELAIHRIRREQDSMGLCLWLLGMVALHQADPASATARLREAAAMAGALGNQDGLAYVLEGLAWTSAADGQGERAARLLGAATARREALGQSRWPHSREEVETGVAPMRKTLGEERWAAATVAGKVLSFEEAIDEALGKSGEAARSARSV